MRGRRLAAGSGSVNSVEHGPAWEEGLGIGGTVQAAELDCSDPI